jgi:hypothetical protein
MSAESPTRSALLVMIDQTGAAVQDHREPSSSREVDRIYIWVCVDVIAPNHVAPVLGTLPDSRAEV